MINRKVQTYRLTTCGVPPNSIGTNSMIFILKSIFHGKENTTNIQVDNV